MAQVAPRTVNPDLFPIAVLIDELRHDDVQTRLNAVQQLEHIAIALGPMRTRNELIPFLIESADENDVVLGATAEKLGSLVNAVGGTEYAHTLIKPLEDLLMLDEGTVRDKAMSSIVTVLSQMPTKHVAEFGIQLVSRLATNDWFAARVSACNLLPDISARAYSDDLLKLFLDLCDDDTPMVRRAAMIALGKIAKSVPSAKLRDLLDALRRLARDDQDSVRIMTIQTAMTLAKEVLSNPQECFNALFPEIRSCVDDPSWRVRVTVAETIFDALNLTPAKHQQQVLDMYLKLLADAESEVRTIAVSKLHAVASLRPADRNFVNLILPSLTKLSRDEGDSVRSALAESLAKTCPVVGPDLTTDSLLQFFLKLMRDTSTNVRLKVLANLGQISPHLKLKELSPCVLPAVVELASDRDWRIRVSVIEQTAGLAKSLGHEMFGTEIVPLLVRWLRDPIFKVREAASKSLSALTAELGATKTVELIIPQIEDLAKNSNYLYRIAALIAVINTAQTLGSPHVGEKLVPIVTGMVKDQVPNVRFNVAKTFRNLYGIAPKKIGLEQIVPAIRQLSTDVDKDVQFFAQEAIAAIDNA